jgi:cytochrome c oxidase assembly protein subunit 15
VGFLTIILAAWIWFADQRRWLRWFGVGALVSVVAQGILGGMTVLFFLPPAVSTAHAGLAEIFFCMTVAIALFTSPGWIAGYDPGPDASVGAAAPASPQLRRLATTTTLLVYAQILIGATMRHTGAGLAIPDFPWMFGHVVPDHWSGAIAIHFAHRLGAIVVAIVAVGTSIYVWLRHQDRPELARPATLVIFLLVIQVTLGALTVISRRDVLVNSLHVVVGALVLTTSLVLTLRSWRGRFAETVRLKPDTTTVTTAAVADVRSVRLQTDQGSRA